MKLKNYLHEVLQRPEKEMTFNSKPSILDNYLSIKMTGLNVERSYEDREVFIEISLKNTEENKSDLHMAGDPIRTWIRGEDSIELGKMLIDAGNSALEFNRENAYEIIELLAAKEGIYKNLYSRLIITKKSDEVPTNYGHGFKYYDLLYVSNTEMESRLIQNVVIYFSPFEEEFNKQIRNYAGYLKTDLIGFTYKEIKDNFEKEQREFDLNNN